MKGVKIRKISVSGLNNVKNGAISLYVKKDYGTSILGVYGQNGSGKTTLIDAVQLLKFALTGQPIPGSVKDYINVDMNHADLSFDFDIENQSGKYQAYYSFQLRKVLQNEETDTYGVEISHEMLSYAYEGESGTQKKEVLMNTDCDKVFIPDLKYRYLFGSYKDPVFTELMIAKGLARKSSQSFIFSAEFLRLLEKKQKEKKEDPVYQRHVTLITMLHKYGMADLQIINTRVTNIIGSTNQMPIHVWYRRDTSLNVGRFLIPADQPTDIPDEIFGRVKEIVENINIVLKELVPGMQVKLEELGRSVGQDGQPAEHVQLVSVRNGKKIPFYNESEGIRKIISILQLLIAAYNDPDVTIAIDELDSGIFEYLLGELLQIFSEEGKGQLIFTSHNLRALEVLDKRFVAFTTTNPSNRYVHPKNIKNTNNLRDVYYRSIAIGEQDDLLYEPTDNDEIALAMRRAGKVIHD